ncbi:MAG: DoxX family protein [Acidimicrobiales bacterium]|jgi:uncharacterized membrane protein
MDFMRPVSPRMLAAVFILSGTTHLVRPQVFDALMPRVLPKGSHRGLIYASGAAELACAFGLLLQRRWAGSLSVLVLAAVWPANLQMALDAGTGRHPGLADSGIVAWGRLPLQIPMLQAAWRARSVSASPMQG